MGRANDKVLFWASFFTLIAAGMGFAIRSDIMTLWGRQFGFTQTELGEITGMGLMGFGLTIIFFSFFADLVGFGWLMLIAFLLHAASVVVTLAAPIAFQTQYGKAGAYWSLWIGQLCFSFANGTCEAVINPLTANLFPKNKTHWLNILHAGWPGGLVLGALAGLAFNQFGGTGWLGWPIRWGVVGLPVLLYGLMMLGRRFPTSEAKEHGVSSRQMMGELGVLGALVATVLIGLWLSKDVVPALSTWLFGREPGSLVIPDWFGWLAAGLLWLAFSLGTSLRMGPDRPLMISLGHWILAFLLVIHAMIGYVELGTDNWIQDITKIGVIEKDFTFKFGSFNIVLAVSLIAFLWTNIFMFLLRFVAGPIVHKISPVGLLFFSAVIGTAGLWMLGMPTINTFWLWMGAVTVYGIGKTFYWPTMLGVISERFPRGGALALGFSGGIGMLSAGILGGPFIGYKQDYASTQKLQETSPLTYERYKSSPPKSPAPFLPEVAGLDNAKVGVLADDGKQLAEDLKLAPNDKNLLERQAWWNRAKNQVDKDKGPIEEARVYGGKTALTWTAAVPATMAVCYLLLIFYFLARGGYKQEVLVGASGEEKEETYGVK
jgi:MFS family permease